MDFLDVGLAAFDLDGTMLNRQSQMSEGNKEACRALQAQGCKLLLATGRTYLSASMACDQYPFDGYVCSNGAAIYEADGTLIQSVNLPPDIVTDAVDMIKQRTIYYEVHDTLSNRWMIQEDRARVEQELLPQEDKHGAFSLRNYSFHKLTKVIEQEELFRKIRSGENQIVKVFYWHPDPAEILWVREQLAPLGERIHLTSSGSRNVELVAPGVNKWQGLQHFTRRWGITAERIAAFGDAANDTDILSQVGVSVAMGNASDEIKQLTRYTTRSHEEDGVAHFIRERLWKNI
ncbi:HAD family hydrolase [Brevibacillus dissolubilis]|uniref:HAD family hydrolase n=1 Tax=Brevibacillus dissolubilis TaxID=1844116 RepID=UPI001116EAD1|nr:HAD family hydrolase [Brevibacillus dissolubilis]